MKPLKNNLQKLNKLVLAKLKEKKIKLLLVKLKKSCEATAKRYIYKQVNQINRIFEWNA